MTKSKKAVKYLIDVWDEVQGNWREKPDHVQQIFLEAEKEQENPLLDGYVKMKEPCYLDGSFDNEGYLIGGKFTDVYLNIKELESKRI